MVRTVQTLGTGTLMGKDNIELAYHLIPIHADDRPPLGFQWRGMFCDAMFSFGLRSAPKNFTAVADALGWCLCQGGIELIYHYWSFVL